VDVVFDNLPPAARQSVREDLELVRRRGPTPAGGPDNIRIVALDGEGVPADVPAHSLRPPAAETPTRFGERCEWERRRQAFQLIRQGRDLWVIGGGAPGALYGFGETLECLTGVIWAGLHDEDVLFGRPRPLPEGPRRPRFAFRGREVGPPADNLREYLRWMGRNRYNLWKRNSHHWASLSPERRRAILAMLEARCMYLSLGDHSMHLWLPEDEFERHPEWFGMRDGRRTVRAPVVLPECPGLKIQGSIQPCYSNEAAAEYITDAIAAHMRETPEAAIFALWPHDGSNNWCQCPECLKKTPYEHIYALAMRLLDKLPAHVPVETIAYSSMLNPPWHELPRTDRIYTLFCPYLRRYDHRIYEEGGPQKPVLGSRYPEPDRTNPVDDREYGKLFDAWAKVCEQSGSAMGVFDYAFPFFDETRRLDRPRYVYHPPIELRCEEIEWYARRGVVVYFICSPYTAWPDNFHEVTVARWAAFEEQRPLDTVIGDFYVALAGQQGPALREALRAVADRLLAEQTPSEEFERLDEVLGRLPDSPARERPRLWRRYIALGRKARELELAGEYEKAADAEKEVHRFLAENEPALRNYMHLRPLTSIARRGEQRLRELLGGRQE